MMLITPSGTGNGVGTGVGLGVGVNVVVGDGASVGDEALGAGVSLPVAAPEGSGAWVGELSACVPPPQAASAVPKSTISDTISNGPFIYSYQVLEPASRKFSHYRIIPYPQSLSTACGSVTRLSAELSVLGHVDGPPGQGRPPQPRI
jgi:hypothetical protein